MLGNVSAAIAGKTPPVWWLSCPTTAFSRASPDGWDCARGYVASRGACIAVEIPPNAHLNRRGDGWICATALLEAHSIARRFRFPIMRT